MSRQYAAGFLVLLTAWIAGCEVAPYRPSSPDYVNGEIRRCSADNRRSHAEVVSAYERARSAGRINPAEAQQFNAMDARLRNMRAELGRDGLTLKECQYIGGEIARARDEVARMASYDPALARCMADNRQAHQDTVALYENARQSGRINPNEAQRFNAIQARLQNLRSELARDGLSMQDCQRLGGAIATERAEVTRMARNDSTLARCMADNRRAHDEIYLVYNEGVRVGRIDPREAQQFAAIDKRLRNFQASLKRDGMTLDECQRAGNAIAQERAIVDKMGIR